MTRWRPDTCACEIEYNDSINVVAVFNKCIKHAATSNDVQHLDTVLAHNRRKNSVQNAVVDRHKALGLDSSSVFTSYDDNDDLHVNGSKLTPADQAALTISLAGLLGKAALLF